MQNEEEFEPFLYVKDGKYLYWEYLPKQSVSIGNVINAIKIIDYFIYMMPEVSEDFLEGYLFGVSQLFSYNLKTFLKKGKPYVKELYTTFAKHKRERYYIRRATGEAFNG